MEKSITKFLKKEPCMKQGSLDSDFITKPYFKLRFPQVVIFRVCYNICLNEI